MKYKFTEIINTELAYPVLTMISCKEESEHVFGLCNTYVKTYGNIILDMHILSQDESKRKILILGEEDVSTPYGKQRQLVFREPKKSKELLKKLNELHDNAELYCTPKECE